MLFEFRHYTCKPGQRDAWVDYMEEVVIPFQESKGMVIVGTFRGEEDENSYYWIRRFNSEEERKTQYEAVYQSDEWRNEMGPRVPDMIDREAIKVTRLIPTSGSGLR